MAMQQNNDLLSRFLGQGSIYHALRYEDENIYSEPDVEANIDDFEFKGRLSQLQYSTGGESSSAGLPSGIADTTRFGDNGDDDEYDQHDEPSPDIIIDRAATYDDRGPISTGTAAPPDRDYSHRTVVPDVTLEESHDEEEQDEVPRSLMYESPHINGGRFRRPGDGLYPSPAEMSFRYKNSWMGLPPGSSYPAPPVPMDLPAPPADIVPRLPKWINLESSYAAGLKGPGASMIGESKMRLPPPPSRVEDSIPGRRHLSASTEDEAARLTRLRINDARNIAIWRWANVKNLDIFLTEVYDYYTGKGLYNILLMRVINLATFAFVVGFSIYLGSCIDFSLIRTSHSLKEVEVPHCMSRLGGFSKFCLWILTFVWFIRLADYIIDFPRLLHIRDFYHHLLGINNSDIQTISWHQVAAQIMQLRDDNPLTSATAQRKYLGHMSKERMEERDIAHRIMRRDNYYIAMIDKDILDFSIPIPFLRSQRWLTRSLKFNLDLCIMYFVFNSQGQINSTFLKYDKRKELSEALRRRFVIAGAFNLVFAPFFMVYLSLLYFFQYFDEYHKNPGSFSARQYSSFAEWKFRGYNELYHSFRRRLDLSCYPATEYVNQFPKEMLNQIMRFVVVVAGAFAAVLAVVTIIDPEVFLGFEITQDRNVLFYIGVFGSLLAAARGMIQDERLVYDPEANLRYVAEFTHFLPSEWNGRLHTEEVKNEFTKYYCLKIVLILQEMLSMILTPFVLWFSLTKSCDKIVDFFRDCSLYEDGLGYVCTFAVYDFSKKPRLNQMHRHST